MTPILIRAFGRFYRTSIPDWLHLWLMRRSEKPGDTIKIKWPSHGRDK